MTDKFKQINISAKQSNRPQNSQKNATLRAKLCKITQIKSKVTKSYERLRRAHDDEASLPLSVTLYVHLPPCLTL